jgi:hypothetical protein
MRQKLIPTLTSALAIGGLLLIGGCDEYHPPAQEPAAQQPPPAPFGAEGRTSTLGKAKDAAERTRDRMDDYHDRVLGELENQDLP